MRFFSSMLLGLLSIVNAAQNVQPPQPQPQRSSMIEYRDLDPEGIPPQHRAGLGIESHFNLQAAAAATWNYKRNDLANGPATWATSGDPQCGGKSQSPIDIATTTTSYDAKLPPLKATFGTYKNITVINNGHTVQVSPATGDISSSFSGGSLNGTYNVIQFHFHQISEHTVNGAGFAAELHIVGLNADPLHQADTDPLQLAVIGVFLQENPTPTATPHPVLQSILGAARAGGLATIGNTANLDINMKTLWATDNPAFWTYPGSLTTPNCRETVTWHVLRDPLFVNAAQLYELRTYLGNDETGKYNNRITMPLGTRVVRTNVLAVANNKGSASANSVSLTGALTMIAAFASTFLARFF